MTVTLLRPQPIIVHNESSAGTTHDSDIAGTGPGIDVDNSISPAEIVEVATKSGCCITLLTLYLSPPFK